MFSYLKGKKEEYRTTVDAYIKTVNHNKGKLDVSLLAYSYLAAIEKLKEHDVYDFQFTLPKGEVVDVNINHHVIEIRNFIKRKVLLDFMNEQEVEDAIRIRL